MSVTRCFLKTCMNCDKFGGGSTYIAVSVERLLQASKYRGDGTISTYTSKTHIKRYLSPKKIDLKLEPTKKRSRRSEELFSFRKHCLFCGEECISVRDSKNPNRWRLRTN